MENWFFFSYFIIIINFTSAGAKANGNVTVAYHVNTVGGTISYNSASKIVGSIAGSTDDSTPAGVCASTYGNKVFFIVFPHSLTLLSRF